MKLLGAEIDNELSFRKHISTLGKKRSDQLNAINRIQKFMGFKEKNIVKGALSGLRQFLTTEILLKMMKNVFFFALKTLLFSRYLIFFLTCWSCRKTA